jgi:hypothetical protein
VEVQVEVAKQFVNGEEETLKEGETGVEDEE